MIIRQGTTDPETPTRPTVTIIGDILGAITGATADASVTFALPSDVTIRDSTDNEVRVPQSQTFTAAQIAGGIRIPPTDDATAAPSTWNYLLTESWPAGRKGVSVVVPSTATSIRYVDLEVVP